MTFTSIGDLSTLLQTQRRNTELKTHIGRLTQELASGRTSDVTRHLAGSFGQLADVEHQQRFQTAMLSATQEAAQFTGAMQTALQLIQSEISDLGATTALAATTPGQTPRSAAAGQATGVLDAIVAALNVDVAGRSLFAGSDVSGAPLGNSQALIDAARSAVSGATDASGVMAALDGFFGVGGGFETSIYQGGLSDMSPFQLGEGQSVQLAIRADDTALRNTMKNTLAVIFADDATLGLNVVDRDSILSRAGGALLTGADAITRIQADLGYAEQRIEQSSSRIAAELTSLEFARNDILAIDPFDAASELEGAQFQLEALYTVTARSSRLNLMNFLS